MARQRDNVTDFPGKCWLNLGLRTVHIVPGLSCSVAPCLALVLVMTVEFGLALNLFWLISDSLDAALPCAPPTASPPAFLRRRAHKISRFGDLTWRSTG